MVITCGLLLLGKDMNYTLKQSIEEASEFWITVSMICNCKCEALKGIAQQELGTESDGL